jgi:hypothetical protein
MLWLGAACGGDKASGPGAVTYDLLYVDGDPLPANIASTMFSSEDLVGGKLVLSGATATVVQSREVNTSASTTEASDTVRYAYRRSGNQLVLRDQADGSVAGTIDVDSAIAPDLYLHWSTTIVGQRGSRAATLTYIKHASATQPT